MIFHDSDLDVLGHAVIPLSGWDLLQRRLQNRQHSCWNLLSYLRFDNACDSVRESRGLVEPSAQWELGVRSEAASLNQIMYMILFLLERRVLGLGLSVKGPGCVFGE